MKDFEDFRRDFPEESGSVSEREHTSARKKLLQRCRERCLYLITDAEKTESRLREKLRRSGKYPEDIIEETMLFLKEYGYLDDARFAEGLIRSYAGKKSEKEIEQKLYQRGLHPEEIRRALRLFRESGEKESSEEQAIQLQLRKKCRDLSLLDKAEKQRLYASLLRKGFSPSLLRKALNAETEIEY